MQSALLYLAAYNTRADILFALCKLAKACRSLERRIIHEALRCLLGYLKHKPDLAIKCCPYPKDSLINEICEVTRVPKLEQMQAGRIALTQEDLWLGA
jgi:hypothetical protein